MFIIFYVLDILIALGRVEAFLAYKAGTDGGSSGSPIFKLVEGKLEIVGLHRKVKGRYNCKATCTNCHGKRYIKAFNFGSSFKTIYDSMDSSYSHPSGNF